MEQKSAKQILLNYQEGIATDDEKAFIENWVLYGNIPGHTDLTDDELSQDLAEIRQRLKINETKKVIKLWPRIAAAASIVLFFSAGAYLLLHKQQPRQVAVLHNDIAPGSDKAILTLSNGEQINLADAGPGVLASQGKTTIKKISPGEVVYNANNESGATVVTYNTITIPKAGKWHVVLPDGSKAWLDASSSIRFPTAFTGSERIIKITGQVYFEVVHNAAKPFRVICNGQTVEDIGTHFNINAYADEPSVKTTLLEGSVKVYIPNSSSKLVRTGVALKPGQQSVIASSNSSKILIQHAEEDVIAWKDNYFDFKKASIQTVMREFARWYDVDIAYEGKAPTLMITGKVRRNVNASESLKILSYLGIHYRITNTKITITP